MIYVDGVAYPTTVSADGVSYLVGTSVQVLWSQKVLVKDIWIAGDITGSGSAGRTIDFDIQKNTDIYVKQARPLSMESSQVVRLPRRPRHSMVPR